MQTKPNVVNIGLESKLIRKTQTRCTWIEDREQEKGVEGFMRSRQSTKMMYQLLSIIKSQPVTVSDVAKMFPVNSTNKNDNQPTPIKEPQQQQQFPQEQQQEPQLQQQPYSPTSHSQSNTPTIDLQLQQILPQQQVHQPQSQVQLSYQTISPHMSKANTVYIPNLNQQSSSSGVVDHINQQETPNKKRHNIIKRVEKKKKKSHFYPDNKKKKKDNQQENNNTIQSPNTNTLNCLNLNLKDSQPFYIIPTKYQSNLQFLITHFLKFQIYNNTNKESNPSTSLSKRPQTTGKNLRYNKAQTLTNTQTNKPSTANIYKTINPHTQHNTNPISPQQLSASLTQDLNQHLQNLLVMQKQLQKKSKKIILLQNQLLSCSMTIKQKNTQLKQFQLRQNCLKKKFKYQIQKMMKGKVMTDINELFLSNLSESNNFGRSVFEINGKKYVKTEQILGTSNESTFMTTPKMSMFLRSNQSSFQLMGKAQTNQALKKSQSSITLTKKSRLGSKNLETIRINKQLQSVSKQISRLEQQRSQLFYKLEQYNAKIQKSIQTIQQQIQLKKEQIIKLTEELQRLKQN